VKRTLKRGLKVPEIVKEEGVVTFLFAGLWIAVRVAFCLASAELNRHPGFAVRFVFGVSTGLLAKSARIPKYPISSGISATVDFFVVVAFWLWAEVFLVGFTLVAFANPQIFRLVLAELDEFGLSGLSIRLF